MMLFFHCFFNQQFLIITIEENVKRQSRPETEQQMLL